MRVSESAKVLLEKKRIMKRGNNRNVGRRFKEDLEDYKGRKLIVATERG